MIPKGQLEEVLRIAESKIDTSPKRVGEIEIKVGDSFQRAQMGGFNTYTFEVVGFVSARTLFIYENDPRWWREDWERYGHEHRQQIGAVLKLKKATSERYEIQDLTRVAPIIENQR